MKQFFVSASSFLAIGVLLSSCNDPRTTEARKPIVMGDSATIVTETDSLFLVNNVPDMIPPAALTAPISAADTATPAAQPARTAATLDGVPIDFGNITFLLKDADIKETGKSFKGSNSAVLTATKKDFNPLSLSVASGSITKLEQRTQHSIVAVKGNDELALPEYATVTSGWQNMRAAGANIYPLSGLYKPEFADITTAKLVSAVDKAVRQKRLSRKDANAWREVAKNAKKVDEKNFRSQLKNVVWKISGKDAAGKAFSKEVRVDVPF